MAQPYPIPRQDRQTDIFDGNGSDTYGPFDFKIFDTVDVEVQTKALGELAFTVQAVTVAKVDPTLPFDYFTVQFAAALPVTTEYLVRSVRVAERSAGVDNGTRISMTALEKELSKQATVQQEVRRDIGRAIMSDYDAGPLTLVAGFADGDTLMKEGNLIVPGPSADNVANAQGYADAAEEAAAQAIAAAYGIVANRTVMKAIDITKRQFATIALEGKRNGPFSWLTDKDYTALVAADPSEGIYVSKPGVSPSLGCWVRQFNSCWKTGWFGLSPVATEAANVTAWNGMMALAVLQPTFIEADQGTHLFNAKLAKTLPFYLVMEFTRATEFRWSNSDGGMELTYSDDLSPPIIVSPKFTTTFAGGGKALKIIAPVSASVTSNGAKISDLIARGVNETTQYWTGGLHCVNCWYPQVIRPDIRGKLEATSPFSMPIGIEMESCQAYCIADKKIFHCTTGIKTTGATHGEGIQITGGEIVGVTDGIDHRPGSQVPGKSITGVHINAERRDILLSNVVQIDVSGNELYKTHTSTQAFQGIEMAQVLDSFICRNTVGSPGVTTVTSDFGITGSGCSGNNISDNTDSFMTNAGNLVLLLNSPNNKVCNNTRSATSNASQPTIGVADDTTYNYFRGNTPQGANTFPVNDTTPNVGADTFDGNYITANTATTAITTFDNMAVGQQITIQINDVHTAFTQGTLLLKGSASITVGTGAGNTISFVKRPDGKICETARSF